MKVFFNKCFDSRNPKKNHQTVILYETEDKKYFLTRSLTFDVNDNIHLNGKMDMVLLYHSDEHGTEKELVLALAQTRSVKKAFSEIGHFLAYREAAN